MIVRIHTGCIGFLCNVLYVQIFGRVLKNNVKIFFGGKHQGFSNYNSFIIFLRYLRIRMTNCKLYLVVKKDFISLHRNLCGGPNAIYFNLVKNLCFFEKKKTMFAIKGTLSGSRTRTSI